MSETLIEETPIEETPIEEPKVEETPTELLAGKYGDVNELEKGYAELQKKYSQRYGGFTGAPEEYSLTPTENVTQEDLDLLKDHPVISKMMEDGKEQEMSNDMLNKIVINYVETEREQNKIRLEQERVKLGDNADLRIKNIVGKLDAHPLLSKEPDILNGLKQDLRSAESIEALELLLQVDNVAPEGTAPSKDSLREEYEKARFELDDRGRRKMLDPKHASKVRKMAEMLQS